MQRGSRPRNSGIPSFLSLRPDPDTATTTPGEGLATVGQLRALRKVFGRPRPRGVDPGAALMGRGWTGRGRGSSPGPGGGAGLARGAARRGGGAAWSTRQLRRPPGTLDPSAREVKARAAHRQLSEVGVEFARRLHGGICGAGRGGGGLEPASRGEGPPAWGLVGWIASDEEPSRDRGTHTQDPGRGKARTQTLGMGHAPLGPVGPFPAPPPGPCPVTKTGLSASKPPPLNSRWRPSRQPLLNFSRRGRAGHAVPKAPGRSGYSRGNPQTPLGLRNTNPLRPASSSALRRWGSGSEPPRGPQPSSPRSEPWGRELWGKGGTWELGSFQNAGPLFQMGRARLCTPVGACLHGHAPLLRPLCLSLSVCPGVLGHPRGRGSDLWVCTRVLTACLLTPPSLTQVYSGPDARKPPPQGAEAPPPVI